MTNKTDPAPIHCLISYIEAKDELNGLLMNEKWDYAAALTALLIFGLSLSARVRPDGFDNAGYSLTARAIVQYGTTRVDPIVGKLTGLGSCGGGDCQVVVFSGRTYALTSRGDALYNYYPIGTSIAILPVVAVAQVAGYEISGANAKFLEYWLAAISVVLAYVLSYAIFRSFVSPKASWLWSSGFILASPLISTMGSALWSSNYAVMFSLASICLLIRRPFNNRFFWASSIAFLSFISFLCKPTNALLILIILIYIFVKLRKYTISFIINIIFFAIMFITYSLLTFNQLLPPYYASGSWQNQFSLSGLWGVLASPSRGLFIYQPYLIIIFVLMLKYIRKLSNNILFILIIIFILIYIYSVVSMTVWWGGFCFGSRLMAELFPFIILLSAMLWQIVTNEKSRSVQRLSTISLFVLFIPGILINTGQGLYNPNVLAWNGISGQSFSINKDTEYLWNWRYPQFSASADSIAERNHEAAAQGLRDALPRLTNYTFGTIITPDSNIAVFDNWLNVERGDGQAWRWSNGGTATIWLRLPSATASSAKSGRLTLTGNPYTSYTVDVFINQVYLGTIESDQMWPAQSYSFDIKDVNNLRYGDYNSIEFKARQQIAPQDDGLQRALYIQSLLLENN